MKIWLDNEIVDASTVVIDDDGWPSGDGIFETLRTEKGKVFELARHMRRAGTAAKNFKIKLPSEDEILEAIRQLLIAEDHEIGRLRLLFSKDHFIAVHQSYREITAPAKLKMADSSKSISAIAFKTFPYTHRLELLEDARINGFDEIICVTESGEITEGAVSNYLFLLDGKWITTPLSSGVLPGVQRAIVIERAGVEVKSINRADLNRVSAALVISSLKIALPVQAINDRILEIGQETLDLVAKIRAQTQSHSVG